MKPFLQPRQKSTDSGSKWHGSNGSSVNARSIGTNFGSVPFGPSVNEVFVSVGGPRIQQQKDRPFTYSGIQT